MNDAFARILLPNFRKTLDLLDQLEREEQSREQVKATVMKWIDEADRKLSIDPNLSHQYNELGPARGTNVMFGARYAVIAWIEEMLTQSEWGKRVKWGLENDSLEWEYYKVRNYATWFYDSADTAKKYDCLDALEVHLLCVTLGFQGKFRSKPQAFTEWVSEIYALVAKNNESTNLELGADQPITPLRSRLGGRILLRTSILTSITTFVSLLIYFLSVHLVASSS